MTNGELVIVADEDMPLVHNLFGPFGKVILLPGREICSDHVKDADLLLVRSVTQVNERLLKGSNVKFIGSATIGIDHVDRGYLSAHGIHFTAAPGCNANAVIEYVLSSMCRLQPDWRNKTVGIVGCGNVGGRLYHLLSSIGVSCYGYDPYLLSTDFRSTTFEKILACDIICLHTPLTTQGPYPTYHLFNHRVLNCLRPGTVLINAGRGDVIDNSALLKQLSSGADLSVALDVWSSEPDIDRQLMERVSIATPHIAGHSLEGKVRGSTMVFDAFLRWINQDHDYSAFTKPKPADMVANVSTINDAILACYDVCEDDKRMRDLMLSSTESTGMVFDRLRREYQLRREFGATILSRQKLESCEVTNLMRLGFRLDDTH